MPVIKKKLKEMNPVRTIVLSFLGVIFFGTLFLILPFSSKDLVFTPFQDAFFTATSATCVTGLVVVDTYAYWSLFGQIIILLMIQIGGLGLLTFVTLFNFAIRKKLGLRKMQLAADSINSDTFSDSRSVLRTVIRFSLTTELIGALILMTVFIPDFGLSQGLFASIFIAISAFCNAGFDVLGITTPYASLTEYYSNPIVLITVMGLIICGGLGFLVWHDLKNYTKTKRLELHTKVVLLTTSALILIGTIIFLITEWSNTATLYEMSFGEKLLNSAFQSVTCRTAGFNAIDTANMTYASKIASIFLMFIGAAPGSTGGGIKITTFTVIVAVVISVLKGRDDTVLLGRKIDKNVVFKSLTIVILSILFIFICSVSVSLVISQNPNFTQLDMTFESVSAFATVGLSSGITAMFDTFSKIVFSILMFFGRVGPISFILSMSLNSIDKAKNQIIPDGKIMVG